MLETIPFCRNASATAPPCRTSAEVAMTTARLFAVRSRVAPISPQTGHRPQNFTRLPSWLAGASPFGVPSPDPLPSPFGALPKDPLSEAPLLLCVLFELDELPPLNEPQLDERLLLLFDVPLLLDESTSRCCLTSHLSAPPPRPLSRLPPPRHLSRLPPPRPPSRSMSAFPC